MIVGIGTDIVEIERIKKAINRTNNFLLGVFTENEINYFNENNRIESIAGTFAVKEAVSKALGTGFRKFRPKDIEVTRDKLGKPVVVLSDKVINIFNLKNYVVHVTISHTDEYAVAFAVLEVDI